jgi:hypothetical protein
MNGQRANSETYQKDEPKSGSPGLWFIAVAVLGLACACALITCVFRVTGDPAAIQGSGITIVEDRSIGRFERVFLCDLGTLIITHGDEEMLSIETDDNLLRYVESRVQGGTLVLGLSNRVKGKVVQPSKGINYRLSLGQIAGLEVADSGRIQAPVLDVGHLEIRVRDSGDIAVDSLMAHTLQVHVEDSGGVRLGGYVERQEVVVQDSGRYLAGRLESRTAAVVTSDSGEAVLWATEVLHVTATDSGRVRYYGEPRLTRRLSGAGTLARVGEP